VSNTHPDAPHFKLPELLPGDPYCYRSRLHSSECKDITSISYINNEPFLSIESFFSTYIKESYNLFGNIRDVNKSIPLMVWSSVLKRFNVGLMAYIHKHEPILTSKTYNNLQETLNVLKSIEASGIRVNRTLFNEIFDSKVLRAFPSELVYTEYNPYTITGRPSNRFGGINFAALNKSDNTRDTFISRYNDGILVQFDFEAHHLRLLADYLDIDTSSIASIHTELAKMYYNTSSITPEMYLNGKQKTFEIIYGMSNEDYGINLFKEIHSFRNSFNGKNDVTLPSGMTVAVESPSANKLFNYYVQSLEVVKTIPKIRDVLNLLKNTTHHVILYTYDAILIDMEYEDNVILDIITEILTENNRFPVRKTIGATYKSAST
jgi:hypothetical protein